MRNPRPLFSYLSILLTTKEIHATSQNGADREIKGNGTKASSFLGNFSGARFGGNLTNMKIDQKIGYTLRRKRDALKDLFLRTNMDALIDIIS